LGTGPYYYPLTIQGAHSRFLLRCQRLPTTAIDAAQPVFERTFREYGLPERIRTNNGAPFGANALGRLSRLSVWFVRLRIYPEFIAPGKPHQNGQHENLHGTLKKHTARHPSAASRSSSGASTPSARSSTKCDLMKRSEGPYRLIAIGRLAVPIRAT